MMSIQDIQAYLPKYLSEENYRDLLRELDSFPDNIDQRMYTTSLPDNVIFQGDGYESLPFVNLMKIEEGCKYRSGIVLSNTCDMAPENRRLYSSSIIYAPIMNLQKYVENLQNNHIREDVIKNHIKNEHIIRGVFFEWDNTPRHSHRGYIICPPKKELFMKLKRSTNEYIK